MRKEGIERERVRREEERVKVEERGGDQGKGERGRKIGRKRGREERAEHKFEHKPFSTITRFLRHHPPVLVLVRFYLRYLARYGSLLGPQLLELIDDGLCARNVPILRFPSLS